MYVFVFIDTHFNIIVIITYRQTCMFHSTPERLFFHGAPLMTLVFHLVGIV